ncbi:MAG: hypothetical protein R3D63_11225 [Paracoccaceae bacterium]
MRYLVHGVAILGLTLLTQLGGLAWGAGVLSRRRGLRFAAVALIAYAALFGAAHLAAPLAGRVALPCLGAPLRMQSPFYCLALRNFVTPDLRAVARDAAAALADDFPGTVTLALDGGFPFGGVPMLPHLSHADGRKLDFAFFYADDAGYRPGVTASPLGYFAFERVGEETCPPASLTLRWDMHWMRPLLRDLRLERDRTAALVRVLLRDRRVAKVFVEPPLAARLVLSDPRLRFQGCRAARHDDHIHIQI